MLACALRAAIALAILAFGGTAAASPGWIGGRLLFTQNSEPVALDQAQAAAGAEIGLELRSGRTVVTARLDQDGYFIAQGEPGTYRLEYLIVGERAEFVAPQELALEAGTITCAGTIAIEASPLESLGSNVKTPIEIRDDCEEAWPRLHQLAAAAPDDAPEATVLARPGPQFEHSHGRTVRQLLVGLRAEAGIGNHAILRGVYLLPLDRLIIAVEGGVTFESGIDGVAGYEFGGGAGYPLFGPFDGMAVAGVRVSTADDGIKPVLGGTVRITSDVFGFGLRAEALPRPAILFTVDIAPFGVLGILL